MRTTLLTSAILFAFATAATGQIPCVPGAAGFGLQTAAGRGGRVIVVSNLDDRGPGSLRDALEKQKGPRTIVFEVAGYIDLDRRLIVSEPFVTVAGQTAPPPGVTLRYNSLSVATHDVLIQHLRVRIGGRHYRGEPADGIQLLASRTSEVKNVVIDHCSISWAVDENIGFSENGATDVTIRHCIISDALRRSSHKHGGQSSGALVNKGNYRIAFIGNLFANNENRNPKWIDSTSGVFVNNVVYNARNIPDLKPVSPAGPASLAIVGNTVIAGALRNRVATRAFLLQQGAAPGTRLFVSDNVCEGCTGRWQDDVAGSGAGDISARADAPPLWPEGLVARPGSQTLEYVLDHAGARPWDRDEADARAIRSVSDRDGRVVDCVTELPLVLERGVVASATRDAVVLRRGPESSRSRDRYRGYSIKLTATEGAVDTRTVTRFDPSTLTCSIEPPWSEHEIPSPGTRFIVMQSCSLNAGGWPRLEERERRLDLPSNPSEMTPSGYTRLELWIHGFER